MTQCTTTNGVPQGNNKVPEKSNEEQFERNQDIINKVSQGFTMAQVGKEYGISKQRVEQIYSRGFKKDPELLTIAEYCKQKRYSKTKVRNQIKNGEICFVKVGARFFIKTSLKITKTCGNCGKEYEPDRRFRYCSEECRKLSLESQHKKAIWRRFNRLKKEKDRLIEPLML
jgi:predicted nucleic acid-binding Zn ribbon protein